MGARILKQVGILFYLSNSNLKTIHKKNFTITLTGGQIMRYQFENLKMWQNAMDLAEELYKITNSFPESERFGMVSQMQRAVVSMCANIAEGKSREQENVCIQFFYQSRGFVYELIILLKLSSRLYYIKKQTEQKLLEDCNSILSKINNIITGILRKDLYPIGRSKFKLKEELEDEV